MYISDKLVYLELEKTGSTHVIRMLRKLEEGGVIEGKHNRISKSLLASERAIMGSVRNPWDWYVSQWGFGCESQGGLFLRQTGMGLKGYGIREHPRFALRSILHQVFKPVKKWQYVYEDIKDPERFRLWLAMMFDPARKHDIGNGFGSSNISDFAGYLTYSYLYLYSRDTAGLYSSRMRDEGDLCMFDLQQNMLDYSIRNELLEEDLIKVVGQLGIVLNADKHTVLSSAFRTNESARERDLSFYYDQKSIDLVAEREDFIIAKYAYEKPLLRMGN
ncbi:MAG: hypothetical protein R8K22_01095 [Mariprofundaceae bacterium]